MIAAVRVLFCVIGALVCVVCVFSIVLVHTTYVVHTHVNAREPSRDHVVVVSSSVVDGDNVNSSARADARGRQQQSSTS